MKNLIKQLTKRGVVGQIVTAWLEEGENIPQQSTKLTCGQSMHQEVWGVTNGVVCYQLLGKVGDTGIKHVAIRRSMKHILNTTAPGAVATEQVVKSSTLNQDDNLSVGGVIQGVKIITRSLFAPTGWVLCCLTKAEFCLAYNIPLRFEKNLPFLDQPPGKTLWAIGELVVKSLPDKGSVGPEGDPSEKKLGRQQTLTTKRTRKLYQYPRCKLTGL